MGSNGALVSIEGIDGAGKSTQARALAAHLQKSGFDPVLTREPGGAPGAEDIRRLLVEGNPVDDITLLVDYEKNIDLVMKDGVIYKNTLDQ